MRRRQPGPTGVKGSAGSGAIWCDVRSPAERGGRMRKWILSGLAVLMVAAGAASSSSGSATVNSPTGAPMQATGSLLPQQLPRTPPVPVTLEMGFRSAPVDGTVPELERISFEISRSIDFAAWRHRCSLAVLYSSRDPREVCPRSLVGKGSVTSEITVPGNSPVTATGRLLAFYSLGAGRPRILAQVTTGDPLPLVYVLPFTLRPAEDGRPTTVFVP